MFSCHPSGVGKGLKELLHVSTQNGPQKGRASKAPKICHLSLRFLAVIPGEARNNLAGVATDAQDSTENSFMYQETKTDIQTVFETH